eukprot:1234550-Amphidinium_carterae.2
MEWSAFVAKQKSDRSFAEIVEKARTKRLADNHVEKGQAVKSEVCVEFEVSKPFLVGNIGEVKKKLGVERVPAKSLKFVPTMQLPNEQGVTETVYVFGKESDEGLRTANMKVRVNTHLVKTHLSSSDFLEHAHTQELMNHALSGSNEKSGLTNLVNKVPWLQTFSAWEEKRGCNTDVGDEGKSLEEAVQEASSALVGPAASIVSEGPAAQGPHAGSGWQKFFTPSKGAEKMALSRASTEEWSGSRTSEAAAEKQGNTDSAAAPSLQSGVCKMSVAGTEDASTCMGDEASPKTPLQFCPIPSCQVAVSAVGFCDSEGLYGDELVTFENGLHAGDDSLAYWKSKLSLYQLAMGKQDRRGKPALNRAIQRLSAKKECQADATILSGFKTQIGMAEQLVPGVIANCSVGRVLEICDMLAAEEHCVPEHVKVHLLQRKIDELKASKCWAQLVEVASPFDIQTFDLRSPCLAGLSSNPEQKIELYQQHFFNEVIIPLILEGQHEMGTVVELSAVSMNMLGKVDVVELEQLTGVVYDECTCIFRTLIGLLETSLSSHEVSKDRGHERSRCLCVMNM